VLVGSGESAGKVLATVEFFEAWSLGRTRRIRIVASGALCVEDAAAVSLLRIESKFGVGFTTFRLTGSKE